MTCNILIAGVGGQGSVLASKLIAAAALKQGFNVRTTETIGMAQRGGSVVSHIRIGDVFSPLIPPGKANLLIAFEPAEAVRQLPFLAKQGSLLVCDSAVQPVGQTYDSSALLNFLKEQVPGVVIIAGEPIKQKYAKMLNVAILGIAAQSGIFPFNTELIKEVIPEMLPQRFLISNLEAFEMGRRLCHDTIG